MKSLPQHFSIMPRAAHTIKKFCFIFFAAMHCSKLRKYFFFAFGKMTLQPVMKELFYRKRQAQRDVSRRCCPRCCGSLEYRFDLMIIDEWNLRCKHNPRLDAGLCQCL
jgi:hypothetical protein